MASVGRLKEIAERQIRSWPLYADRHKICVRDIGNGVWLGYRTSPSNITHGTSHFDVNIIGNVFYVLSIAVAPEGRGKGHGAALYRVLEDIASEWGCRRVQMTPSGCTSTGESRKDYLLRRGYKPYGDSEVIKVLHD